MDTEQAQQRLDEIANLAKWAARDGQPVADTVHDPDAWKAKAANAATKLADVPASERDAVDTLAQP